MVRRRTATRRRRSSGGRSIIRRARSAMGGSGVIGSALQGAMAGIASQVGQRFLPGYGGPLGVGAVGYFTRNQTLMTLAGLQASALIPVNSFLGGSSSSSTGGGFI